MSTWNIKNEPSSTDCSSVNRHVQASIMLLSIMDGAEIDLNNTILTSSSKTATTTTSSSAATTTASSITTSDDYEKDLQLAAELGRCLLERNQELQSYVNVLQKQIDDEQCDIKLLHAKLESTRDQLDTKCKQTEILDATNFDLERELAQQRRDNERDRQRIKELSNLCEKTRKQCVEIEHEYETFRLKQFATHFFPNKQSNSSTATPNIATMTKTKKVRRARSFDFDAIHKSSSDSSTSSNLFDLSSASMFKTHLTELKSRIHTLTSECTTLNDKLHQSEQEKRYLTNRITQLERQHRDDNDALQNELNYYKKLLERHTNENSQNLLSNVYSPPEHDMSLYDEVLFETKQSLPIKSSYEPTNYKDLFSRVYAKLKPSTNPKTST